MDLILQETFLKAIEEKLDSIMKSMVVYVYLLMVAYGHPWAIEPQTGPNTITDVDFGHP